MEAMSHNYFTPIKDIMDSLNIRYGEYLPLPIETGNEGYVSATMYIGKPGQMYKLSKDAILTNGDGVFEFTEEETKLPLGEYSFQISVFDEEGRPTKFPEPEEDCGACEEEFPKFIVYEALDETEVTA